MLKHVRYLIDEAQAAVTMSEVQMMKVLRDDLMTDELLPWVKKIH